MSAKRADTPKADPAAFERDYQAYQPRAGRFSQELSHELGVLLENQDIALGFPIQSRVKTWPSIAEKLDRLTPRFKQLTDIQDLIGLRLILLFQRDQLKACRLISERFKVVRQYDTQARLKEDQFGYLSTHFVVEMPPEWLKVPSLSGFGGMLAEIQVRTLAQHIWAAASQNLQYKQEQGIPVSVRRSMYRVSVLLETVDLEFERVLAERERYRAELNTAPADDLLNVDSLEQMLDKLLPPAHKDSDEPYAELLSELRNIDITTRRELTGFINRHLPALLAYDARVLAEVLQEPKAQQYQRGATAERNAKGVFLNHVGLVRHAIDVVTWGGTEVDGPR